jgi:hypothetical protein
LSDEEGQKDLEVEIATGDMVRSLEALRSYVAHELQGNRCPSCEMSKLRTGDTAALVLRLQKIIEDISALKPTAKSAEGVVSLDDIRNRRAVNRGSVPQADDVSKLGTKAASRQQGGRQPRFRGDRSC